MNTKFDLKKIYITILAMVCLVLVSMLFSKCENEKVQLKNIKSLNSEAKTYRLKNGQLVLSVETLNYTNEQLKSSLVNKSKELDELMKEFSKIKTIIRYIDKVRIDTITIHYKDTVPCVFERKDSIVKKWFKLSYTSNQRGININDLTIPDSVAIISGMKRKWFLGKQTITTDITHSNPYIQTKELQHIEVVQPSKWYDSTILKVAFGFIGGVLLVK